MDFPLLPLADNIGKTPKETTALAPEMVQAEESFLAIIDTNTPAPETTFDASGPVGPTTPRLSASSDLTSDFLAIPGNADVIASSDTNSEAIALTDVALDPVPQLPVSALSERKSEPTEVFAATPPTDALPSKTSGAPALPMLAGEFTKIDAAKSEPASEVAKASPEGPSSSKPVSATTTPTVIEVSSPVESDPELPAPPKTPLASDQTMPREEATRPAEPLGNPRQNAQDQKSIDLPAPLNLRETPPREAPPASDQKTATAQMPTAETPSKPAATPEVKPFTNPADSDFVTKATATTPLEPQAQATLIPPQFQEGLPRAPSLAETPVPRTGGLPEAATSLPRQSTRVEVSGQVRGDVAQVVQTTASTKTDISTAPPAPTPQAQSATTAPQASVPAPQVTPPPVSQATAPMTVTVAQLRSGELAEPARKAPEIAKTTKTASTATPAPTVALGLNANGQSAAKPEAAVPIIGDVVPLVRDGLIPTSSTGPAGSPAPLQTAAPSLPPQVMAQLAEMAPSLRSGPVEIQLSPEELGRVRLALSTSDTSVQIQIMAERPETQDLIRRHVDILAEDLKRQGFTDVGFSFGDSSDREDFGSARDDSGGLSSSTHESTADIPDIKQTLTIAPSARLDIRL